MEDVLLGIDIGTSACKVAAFTKNGEVLAQTNEGYSVSYPKPGWAEQNPDDWWRAVCCALQRVLETVDAGSIRGIGMDGQSWSAVAIDRSGDVLCNTPLWMDTRATDECEEMKQAVGEEVLFSTSGNPVQPMYTMPKVLWYKKHWPEVYKKADKILQSNSFIAYRLTGAVTQEPSQGYGWNCYDMANGRWNSSLCEALGLRTSLLPEIVPCHAVVGTVTSQAAQLTGLKEGTPVVAGGLDAACGTLGVGVLHSGETQEQGGQAGGMSICLDKPTTDRRLILGAHVVPGKWLLQGGTVGGGGALNWFAKTLSAGNSFSTIDKLAGEVPPGSEGLVFLPYLAGERSPIWDPDAKGVFYGIDFSKTNGHFARSVMEGVAYSLRHNLEVAETAGAKVAVLRAMGGAANSALWMQIKADVTQKQVVVPASDTATALGAAILAGVGTGVYRDFSEAVAYTVQIRKTYAPCAAAKQAYDKGYAAYRELYTTLKQMRNKP